MSVRELLSPLVRYCAFLLLSLSHCHLVDFFFKNHLSRRRRMQASGYALIHRTRHKICPKLKQKTTSIIGRPEFEAVHGAWTPSFFKSSSYSQCGWQSHRLSDSYLAFPGLFFSGTCPKGPSWIQIRRVLVSSLTPPMGLGRFCIHCWINVTIRKESDASLC